MKELNHTLNSLQSKVEKLVLLHKKTKEDLNKAKKDNDKLLKTIENQNSKINELEEKIKTIKLAKQLTNTEKNTDIKYKINELVREIDKCMALLNK